MAKPMFSSFFFFNDTATTEIYTLSLHDALPIYWGKRPHCSPSPYDLGSRRVVCHCSGPRGMQQLSDRKSTRLNSSHQIISYAVFCLKKKKKKCHSDKMQNEERTDPHSI